MARIKRNSIRTKIGEEMAEALRVLIVEDSEDDAMLVLRELKQGGFEVSSKRVDNSAAMKEQLEKGPWDLVIADYNLPGFSALEALRLVREKDPDVTFIIVSGKIGEETAVEAMKLGACDYIMKNNLSRLIPAVKRELEEANLRRQKKAVDKEMVRRDYQLEILSRTSQHINVILEIPVILRTLITAAIELVDGTSGSAGLLKNGKIRFTEYSNKGRLETIDRAFEIGDSVAERVIDAKKPYISNDAERDPGVAPEKQKRLDLYNIVNVPILSNKRDLIGCFEVYNKKDRLPFESQDIFMLQGLAANAAVALENAFMLDERRTSENKIIMLNRDLLASNKKLKKMALIDPHTGIYNYRYLEDAIEAEFHRAKRECGSFSVAMIDLDYFKAINDVYGHQTGDIVLKQLVLKLKKMLRPYDILIRFGGEEFVIILPGAERISALRLAERLLNAIVLDTFGDKSRPIKLKLSFAVASYPEDKVTKGMELFGLTDTILNRVKEDGGNSVYSSLDLKSKNKANLERDMAGSEVESLRGKIEKLTMRGNQSAAEAIFAFARTIGLKDHTTGKHVEKTVFYAADIARMMKLSKDDIRRIEQACILHDLGKIGIMDKILSKRGKLTKREFEEVKKHPQIGVDIIRPLKLLHGIIPLILHHHEWWNGAGYPDGLKGEAIPIGARIVAVADVYQALVSDRPYRKMYSKKEAIKLIEKNSGTQFDPKVVKAFLMTVNRRKVTAPAEEMNE